MKQWTLSLVAVLLAACLLAGCGSKSQAYRPDTASSGQTTGDPDLLIPGYGSSAEDAEDQELTVVDAAPEDLDYQYDAALGGVIIKGYTGSEAAIRIPAEIDGDPVVRIDGIKSSQVKKIELQDGIAEIGSGAFSGCTNLVSVTLPNGVTTIGENTFHGCESLQSVTFPDGIAEIAPGMFRNCTGLVSITLPDSVTTIGEGAFSDCESLQSITIPGSVAVIPSGVFSNCNALESVTLSNGVICIGGSAFIGCSALTNVTIPASVQYVGGISFSGCSALRDMELPDTVFVIEKDAFRNCEALTLTYKGNAYNYTNFEELYTTQLASALGGYFEYKQKLAEAEMFADEDPEYYEYMLAEGEYILQYIEEDVPDPETRAALAALADLLYKPY